MYSFTCPSIRLLYSVAYLFIHFYWLIHLFVHFIYSSIPFVNKTVSLPVSAAATRGKKFKNEKFYSICKEAIPAKLQAVLTDWSSRRTLYSL